MRNVKPVKLTVDFQKPIIEWFETSAFSDIEHLVLEKSRLWWGGNDMINLFLSKFTNIKSLDISNLGQYKKCLPEHKFRPIISTKLFPSLESLRVSTMKNVSRQLTKLTRLECTSELVKVSDLTTFTCLKSLSIYFEDLITSLIDFASDRTTLKTLKIVVKNYVKEYDKKQTMRNQHT